MASNDDGPDFNSAWNPALRPNTLQDARPDHKFEEMRQASSKPTADIMDAENDIDFASKVNGHAPDQKDVDSDDDFFQRYGAPDLNGEPSFTPSEPSQTDISNLPMKESLEYGSTDLSLESADALQQNSAPDVDAAATDMIGPSEEDIGQESGVNEDATGPAENYEHQSRLPLAEEAVDESAAAPLLADIDEPAPIHNTISEGQNGALPPPETHSSSELPSTPEPERLDGPEIDWGNTDDFGLGLENKSSESTGPWGGKEEALDELSGKQDSNGGPEESEPMPRSNDQVDLEELHEVIAETRQEDLDAMWKAALGEDDFLDGSEDIDTSFFPDDDAGFLDDAESEEISHTTTSSTFTQNSQPADQRYGLVSPSQPTTLHGQIQASTTTQRNLYRTQTQPVNAAAAIVSQHQGRPPPPVSSQSFADKSKGGYSSPYDLPMDVSRPKKRSNVQPVAPGPVQRPVPPPRSSSISATSPTSVLPNMPPSSVANLSPPLSSHPNGDPAPKYPSASAPAQKPPLAAKPSTGDFFADLPVTSRPKGTGQSGRFTPSLSTVSLPTAPQPPPTSFSPPKPTRQNLPPDAPFDSQLQAPPELDPFPVQGSADHPGQVRAPPVYDRYSPASQNRPTSGANYAPPPSSGSSTSHIQSSASQPSPVPGSSRYASAPKGPPPSSYAKQYAPRTSSPLASHQTSPQSATNSARSTSNPPKQMPDAAIEQLSQHVTNMSISSEDLSQRVPSPSANQTQFGHRSGSLQRTSGDLAQVTGLGLSTHPPPTTAQTNYVPQNRSQLNLENSDIVASDRARQSPSLTMKGPRSDPVSTQQAAFALSASSPTDPQNPVIYANLGPKQGVSQDLGFIAPADETSRDPLERWKGYPIFHWGMAGQIVASFPKQIPRYGPGHAIPTMKSGPGEICVQSSKTLLPLDETISKFPGPLKSKSKKKDVISWLNQKLETLRQRRHSSISGMTEGSDAQTRQEENVLLWNVVRILVEHDGVLEGNPGVEEAVRNLLTPPKGSALETNTPLSAGADITGIVSSPTTKLTSEPIDPTAIEQLRQHLIKGEREKAVWHAVDKRLWAHALLISSTLSADLWKQVIREFVRHEVRSIGSNTNSLAALYEVFAKNWEESIDELVPAATRAGFQMVSKSDGSGSARNAFEGLDRWRESLCLILSNRTPDDGQAVIALGKLLAGYGRIEAAHICFLFARNLAYVGGSDDPLSNVCLLGADHVHRRLDFGKDMDSILLTEVYEFALSLSVPSATIPHLQPFKLGHASLLAENGHRTEAQQYCDAILAAMKSTTRPSAYYHGALIAQVDDLSKRLSQSPKDASSSWVSKPSMDKMSGTMWKKFQDFVSGGDDSDTGSNRSAGGGEGELGPFSKIAGDSPVISRSTSSTDLYGAYGSAPTLQAAAPVNIRYAPTSHHAPNPRAGLEQGPYSRQNFAGTLQARPSLESSRSFDPLMPASHTTSPEMLRPNFGAHEPRPRSTPYAPHPGYSPQQIPPSDSQSLPSLASSAPSMPYGSWGGSQPALTGSSSTGNEAPFSGRQMSLDGSMQTSYQPSLENSYQAPSTPYEPPSYQPYEPSSTIPDEAIDENQNGRPLPKNKKSFMDADDDDDEFMRRAASLKASQPAQSSSREPDDAVRRAAEADAARDADAKAKKGWFTGWFKKDPNAAPGPIRAKLGEESSFVYDPDLKRWVDKKGGAPPPVPIATPPPPKRPSRSASAAGPPPPPSRTVSSSSSIMGAPPLGSRLPSMVPLPGSGPPSRVASPALGPPASGLQNEIAPGDGPAIVPGPTSHPAAMIGTPAPSGSTPPSQPATSMSNASSIDDLIGAPQARKGGTVKGKKKGGRYVDVMAR